MSKKKYWYLTTIFCCPACGKKEKYRSRQYSAKPKQQEGRYELITDWDYCDCFKDRESENIEEALELIWHVIARFHEISYYAKAIEENDDDPYLLGLIRNCANIGSEESMEAQRLLQAVTAPTEGRDD